jgi:hypothetical protein
MGIIKEFSELPLWVKSIILTILTTIPFWSIILIIYFPEILDMDWYKIIGISFVPSLVWYFLNFLSGYIAYSVVADFEQLSKNKILWITIGIDTILYLVIISALLISLKIPFITFLLILFGYKILVIPLLKPLVKALIKDIIKS